MAEVDVAFAGHRTPDTVGIMKHEVYIVSPIGVVATLNAHPGDPNRFVHHVPKGTQSIEDWLVTIAGKKPNYLKKMFYNAANQNTAVWVAIYGVLTKSEMVRGMTTWDDLDTQIKAGMLKDNIPAISAISVCKSLAFSIKDPVSHDVRIQFLPAWAGETYEGEYFVKKIKSIKDIPFVGGAKSLVLAKPEGEDHAIILRVNTMPIAVGDKVVISDGCFITRVDCYSVLLSAN